MLPFLEASAGDPILGSWRYWPPANSIPRNISRPRRKYRELELGLNLEVGSRGRKTSDLSDNDHRVRYSRIDLLTPPMIAESNPVVIILISGI